MKRWCYTHGEYEDFNEMDPDYRQPHSREKTISLGWLVHELPAGWEETLADVVPEPDYRSTPAIRAEDPPANPKQVFGDKKVGVQFVPPALELFAAQAFKEGVVKGYGPFNWRQSKVEAMTYVGAVKRHLAAWIDGEEIDPESPLGKHHLAGAIASLGILVDALSGGFLIDNRPPRGPAPELVRTPVEKKESK